MPQELTDEQSTLVQVMACAIRQQSITWVNVDPDLSCHTASLGHNELIHHTLYFITIPWSTSDVFSGHLHSVTKMWNNLVNKRIYRARLPMAIHDYINSHTIINLWEYLCHHLLLQCISNGVTTFYHKASDMMLVFITSISAVISVNSQNYLYFISMA